MHLNEILLPFYTQYRQISKQIPSFLKTWMQIWFSFSKERGRVKRKKEGNQRMPGAIMGPPHTSSTAVTSVQHPPPQPQFNSLLFSLMNLFQFAGAEISQKRSEWPLWLACLQSPRTSVLSFFPLYCIGTQAGNVVLHFTFNELVCKQCLGHWQVVNNIVFDIWMPLLLYRR